MADRIPHDELVAMIVNMHARPPPSAVTVPAGPAPPLYLVEDRTDVPDPDEGEDPDIYRWESLYLDRDYLYQRLLIDRSIGERTHPNECSQLRIDLEMSMLQAYHNGQWTFSVTA